MIQVSRTLELLGTAVSRLGAPGTCPPELGITVVEAEDGPAPIDVIACITIVYCVPFTSPLTSAVTPVTAGLKGVKVTPLSEYW